MKQKLKKTGLTNIERMPNLFTITGNLLAETTSAFAPAREGDTVRALGKSTFQVGGKGVNVAKAFFKIREKKAFAIIYPAGFNGNRCVDWLEKTDFCNAVAFFIQGETRSGLVCQNNKNGKQTTYLGEDIPVDSNTFEKSITYIKKHAKNGDFIALSGSFPSWKSRYAKTIAKLAYQKNLKLCIDTYSKPLESLSKEKIFLLKINKNEFLQTFKQKSLSIRNVLNVAKTINVKHFIITNSKGGTYYYSDENVSILKTPKISKEVSATGCGDVMFASIIAELSLSNDFENALKISIARASASAEIPETASWNKTRAKELLKQIL